MIDALGRPQSVLLLGGTSQLALAILTALPPERLTRVVLLGRDPQALKATAEGLDLPGVSVEVEVVDATETADHGRVIDRIFAGGDIDLTVLAVGVLGDQAAAEADPELAVATAQAGFVGPLSLLLHTGRRLRGQGHGTLVVISSVAGRQARRANYVYGSTKAGLDLAALGLGDALQGSGAKVIVVRPGFVRTRMTSHLPTPPLAVDPQDVAAVVVGALRSRRAVVYSPPAARLVSAVLVLLPRWALRRLPF